MFLKGHSVLRFILQQFASNGITDQDLAEYISQIAVEESLEIQQKLESITDILSETNFLDIPSFTAQLEQELYTYSKYENTQTEDNCQINKSTAHPQKEMTLQELQEQKKAKVAAMSREERLRRESLLARYDYDIDEVVQGPNGEMELVYKDKSTKNYVDPLSIKNTNALKVKEAQQNMKAQMVHFLKITDNVQQQAHEAQIRRNKEQLEKQRADAEKKKKNAKSQKQEKRRM